MRFPFLASFIIFLIWLSYQLAKSKRITEKQEKSFWERERLANQTRRKSLDALPYITIPLDTLPMQLCQEDDAVRECTDLVRSLSEQTIVNLTGYSNTDLKLMYGAPNITLLSDYDQNYTLLARTLQKWAALLYKKGFVNETKTILEFAVSTQTDVSGSYKLLASIYKKEGHPEKIASLLETASTLRSAMKPAIVRALQESDPSDG
jgi:hypothetical protein